MNPAQNRRASLPGFLLAGAILIGMTVAPTASSAADIAGQQQLVDKATLTLKAFAADSGLSAALREWSPETRALFIVPQFIRGAFVFGGAGGSGASPAVPQVRGSPGARALPLSFRAAQP